MSAQHFLNEVQIVCDPESVFEYVTNPNRWHEWYPSSQPSNKEYRASEVGQTFEIVTVQKPIKLLPFTIKKALTYTVYKSEYAKIWEVTATSSLVDSTTSYTLTPIANGTSFKREFRYVTKSWLKIIEPIFLRKSIIAQARVGLNNLKARVESENA
ncbi:SRPBCC family protein [Halopseudomonas salegens]|uniref:Polyketide cyclase / dehydrase and lipid transport n=1 Tax=Halopseudomonas salegens TaxID=1434072 RepID=A0A1H2G8T5_9GAMM|nr:SRPBCC family protein [Halopseudomonas salegens]SDU15900.1 Polyketide cyclase / dehydrase and lipid transport [Halopseudomonas salegens]